MVDAGGSDRYWPHGYKWALETARMLANYNVTWFEEALRPDDIEGYIKLTEHAPLPITGCEVLTRRQSFLPWIERRAVDYIQPDVTKVGGLTENSALRCTPTTTRFSSFPTAGTPPSGWQPTCS